MVCILGLFGLATLLAIFQKILGNFFPNHLVTLLANRLAWKKWPFANTLARFTAALVA
jgi:hypothetical protein